MGYPRGVRCVRANRSIELELELETRTRTRTRRPPRSSRYPGSILPFFLLTIGFLFMVAYLSHTLESVLIN